MSELRWNDAGTRESARQSSRPTPDAGPTASRRSVSPRGGPNRQRPPASGGPPRWGRLPWGRGIVLVAVAAGLGALLTIVTGSDPGFLLGLVVVLGTLAASVAVDARRAYLVIPAPALAYLVAGILVGVIHDRATDTSHTMLAINAARWVASVFLGMVVATALAVVITVGRRLRSGRGTGSRQLPPRNSLRSPPRAGSSGEWESSDPGQRRLPR